MILIMPKLDRRVRERGVGSAPLRESPSARPQSATLGEPRGARPETAAPEIVARRASGSLARPARVPSPKGAA
jgi:hypothetical protein